MEGEEEQVTAGYSDKQNVRERERKRKTLCAEGFDGGAEADQFVVEVVVIRRRGEERVAVRYEKVQHCRHLWHAHQRKKRERQREKE